MLNFSELTSSNYDNQPSTSTSYNYNNYNPGPSTSTSSNYNNYNPRPSTSTGSSWNYTVMYPYVSKLILYYFYLLYYFDIFFYLTLYCTTLYFRRETIFSSK